MRELQGKMKEAHKIMIGLEFPVRIDTGEDIQFLTIGSKSNHFLLQTRFTTREEVDEIYAVTQIPFKIPPDLMPAAYVVINEINGRLSTGCFFLSVDMRCIFFRVCIPYFGNLTPDIIETLATTSVSTIDKQMLKFGEKFLFDKQFSLQSLLGGETTEGEKDDMPRLSPARPTGVTLH
jgi:hypothetical protein